MGARGGVGGEGTLPVGQEIGKGAHPRRCATTGWHRKHAVRALRQHAVAADEIGVRRERGRTYGRRSRMR